MIENFKQHGIQPSGGKQVDEEKAQGHVRKVFTFKGCADIANQHNHDGSADGEPQTAYQ